MPITTSADLTLAQVLSDRYRKKVILDDTGLPFIVAYVKVWDDSPDPGWVVIFTEEGYANAKSRTICLGEALPEIWPFEIPMSPCS